MSPCRGRLSAEIVLVALSVVGAAGCKNDRDAPGPLVQKVIVDALQLMPETASALCGARTAGLQTSQVTVTSRGALHKGVVHVEGTPFPGEKLPASCSGDLAFELDYRSHVRVSSRYSKTTWFLKTLTVVAVQTPGVSLVGSKPEYPREQVIVAEDGTVTREPLLQRPPPPPTVVQGGTSPFAPKPAR